jgi:hypothetical protein
VSDGSIFLMLGIALVVVGAACVLIAAWALVTGRQPIWLRRRQSLTEAFVRWWAVGLVLSGLAAIAIGGPFAEGYPVAGSGLILQGIGYLLLLGAVGCWFYVIRRSGYRTP